jgi:predicted transcriptional regulator
MEAAWAEGKPILSKDIHPKLPTGKDLSYTTVVCTMTALMKKGLLKIVDKEGKAHVFLPTMSREDFLHQTLGRILENILEAFPDTASTILTRRTAGPHALEQLRQLTERVDQLDAQEEL